MKSKVKYGLIIILVSITLFSGYRIISINNNIPSEYQLDEYKLNEKIKLDNLSLEVLSVSKDKPKYDKEYKINRVEVKAKFKIKVNSNDSNDVSTLVSMSSLWKVPVKDISEDFERIKSLKTGDSIVVNLTWNMSVDSIEGLSYINIYLPKDLYANQIKAKYNEGFLYGKYIKCSIM